LGKTSRKYDSQGPLHEGVGNRATQWGGPVKQKCYQLPKKKVGGGKSRPPSLHTVTHLWAGTLCQKKKKWTKLKGAGGKLFRKSRVRGGIRTSPGGVGENIQKISEQTQAERDGWGMTCGRCVPGQGTGGVSALCVKGGQTKGGRKGGGKPFFVGSELCTA